MAYSTGQRSVNLEIIILASTLHDVYDYKLSGDEKAGPKAATDWLVRCGADVDLIKHVVEIIETMSFKGQVHRPMQTIEGKIVQDADRLDAVGAIGIARAFAFGGTQGREIFNPEIPYRENLSSTDYKNKTLQTTSLNHFYEKLFKLDGHYNTPLANKIGHQRHEFMMNYVEALLKECGASENEFARKLKHI
ncbi:MAG: hypothetical protein FD179_938 [Erysipelotrichaceae bacterium]|nr:MAG: hypothetical protein FD179_938 [Erysipelotrichaceae bacterium]